MLALRSLRVGQLHDATTDSPQPKSQTLRRYSARVTARGGNPKQERLELARAPVVGRRRGDRLLDDGRGQIRHIKIEAVLQPETEELANIGELHVFVAKTFHADDWIWLAQPDQRAAHHIRPG